MKSTRRAFLQQGGVAATTAILAGLAPRRIGALAAQAASTAAPPSDGVAAMRASGASAPIQVTKLRDTLYLLQGAGGNMIALVGPDGKLLVDSSFATAATRLHQALATLDPHPLKLLVNTHWHFDHTDGNAAAHDAGAFIIAHSNTRVRLSAPQTVPFFHLNLPASPTGALPQQTFDDKQMLFVNDEPIALVHVPPAHTDSDIYVHFQRQNVLHAGDLWFNGFYPFFDQGTGGNINGMIQGVDQCLAVADDKTKIVPGHGPVGDKAGLSRYREMLATTATRIETLKSAGQTLEGTLAAKPTADYDGDWGKGMVPPDAFATLIYTTLP